MLNLNIILMTIDFMNLSITNNNENGLKKCNNKIYWAILLYYHYHMKLYV